MKVKILSSALCCLLLSACSSTAPQSSESLADKAHSLCFNTIYGKEGVEQNDDKAFNYCTEAATYGGSSSQTLLAQLYLNGQGTEKDLNKASELYQLAAAQGHSHAQMMVFKMFNEYLKDQSTPEQKQVGKIYLKTSADKGHEHAQALYQKHFSEQ